MNTMIRRFVFAFCTSLLLAVPAWAQEPLANDSARLPSAQLDQLVAPIALYPDALVAQVLAASTYPDELTAAADWMRQNPSLTGTALADAVNAQSWDPSVKALTQFPSVLSNMAQNFSWTQALGDAYMNQPSDVMGEVQVLRQRAQAAGTLRSTSQQTVTTQGQTIVVQPANPSVVYVPAYDPWLVYGPPIFAYPGWVAVPGVYYSGPGIYWGLGFGIGLYAAYGWGWHHWAFDWRRHALLHDRAPWFSHSPRFGHFGPRAGPHPGPGRDGFRGRDGRGFHGGEEHGFHGGDGRDFHGRDGGGFHGGGGGGFHGGGGEGGFHGGGGGHR